jgi:hypothetical protein
LGTFETPTEDEAARPPDVSSNLSLASISYIPERAPSVVPSEFGISANAFYIIYKDQKLAEGQPAMILPTAEAMHLEDRITAVRKGQAS